MNVPRLARKRPVYRGMVVPFSVMWYDGVPDFKVADPRAVERCIIERKCGLCGERIETRDVVFTGGELSIRNRLFTDPAMHEACARYAHFACPFLNGRITHMAPAEAIERHGPGGWVDPNTSPKRPDRFGLYFAAGYGLVEVRGSVYIRAFYGRVEWLPPA